MFMVKLDDEPLTQSFKKQENIGASLVICGYKAHDEKDGPSSKGSIKFDATEIQFIGSV